MACDERLVQRIRDSLRDIANVHERRMFGGACFTLNGNMFCGVVKDEIMVRVGPDRYLQSLRMPHTREMDFTGLPLAGYVFVAKMGLASDASLRKWLDMAGTFARALPAKATKRRAGSPSRSRAAPHSSRCIDASCSGRHSRRIHVRCRLDLPSDACRQIPVTIRRSRRTPPSSTASAD
jgi:hypothetical protein